MGGLELSLILIYTALLSLVILRTKIFNSTTISKEFIVKLFILKIVVAFLYAYIHFENGWGDTFALFMEAKRISQLFINNPELYFKFIFGTIDRPYTQEIIDALGVEKLHKYHEPRSSFMIRLNALFMPLSYGFYSVQCILFEFFSLLGIFYIYEFLTKRIKINNGLLKLFIFFAPSVLFWLSGFHKDGLTVLGLGALLFATDKLFDKRYIYIIILLLALVFTFFIRDYALLLFLPPFIGYLFARKSKKRYYLPFLLIYGLSIIFFFTAENLDPRLDFPHRFVRYQEGFTGVPGESSFEVVPLEPTVESFATSLPIALFNTLFKPNFTQTHTFWSSLAATENVFYILCAIFMIPFINYKRYNYEQRSALLIFIIFGLSYFLTLGLIVNNLGAVVRYKTTPLIFLGSALILLFDAHKFEKFFRIKNHRFTKYVD